MERITVKREDDTTYETIAVVTFNNGYSHFIEDDSCYVLINGENVSPWLFSEAIDVLKTLPDPKRVHNAKIIP